MITLTLAVLATLAIVVAVTALLQVIVAAIIDDDWECMKTHLTIGNVAFAVYLMIAIALSTWGAP